MSLSLILDRLVDICLICLRNFSLSSVFVTPVMMGDSRIRCERGLADASRFTVYRIRKHARTIRLLTNECVSDTHLCVLDVFLMRVSYINVLGACLRCVSQTPMVPMCLILDRS